MSINDLKSIVKSIPSNFYAGRDLVVAVHTEAGERDPSLRYKYVSSGFARTINLAYAFLRGRAYRSVEPVTQDLVEKYGSDGKNLALSVSLVANHHREEGTAAYTLGDVQAWMAIPETETRAAKRAAAKAKAVAKRAAHAAQFEAYQNPTSPAMEMAVSFDKAMA